jgi:aryl-alcohol dehydrogenase-like predicted oxidoreductase
VIPGSATAEGTAGYRARLGATAVAAGFRSFRGWTLSSLGLGTYLGEADDVTDVAYRAAVARALALGINVLDSAVNYRDQRSERAIGAALADAIAGGRVRREEVVVATKGGFIPFDAAIPGDRRAYLTDTYVRTGLVRPEEVVGGVHCLAPRFLADQIERSRRNLGLDTIDVYYLHNPEMQLGSVDGGTFLRRMRAAFELLESAAADGTIGLYGTATWSGYRQSPGAADHLSLSALVGLAAEVGGAEHHFRVIQAPYNLAMTEALALPNQEVKGGRVCLLEAARRLGLYVVTSASLYQGQLARGLPAMFAELLPGLDTDAQRAVQFARSTPGVGTALVGMSRVGHVEDVARLCAVPPLSREAFRRLFEEA